MSNKLTSRQYVEQLLERSHREPNNVYLHVSIGEACLRNGDTDGAFKAFNRAAELDPSSYFRSLVYEWSGYINRKAGKVSEAITAYNQWAQIDRASSFPLDRWGAVLARENMAVDLLLLRSMYKKRLEQSPDDPELRASLALLSFVLGQDAIDEETTLLELASSALEAEYDSLPMRYLMGLLYMRIAHFESADSEFKKVVELDPEQTWCEYRFNLNWSSESAMLMRARIAHIQRRYDDALRLCSDCIDNSDKLNPFAPIEEIISIHMEREEYIRALQIFSAFGPLLTESPSLRRMYSRCLLGAGQIEAAAQIYENAQKKEEPDAEQRSQNNASNSESASSGVKDEIAAASASTTLESELLCDSGEYDKAIEAWKKLLLTYPDNLSLTADAAVGAAKVYARQERYDKAISVLEGCMTTNPKVAKNLEIWKLLSNYYKTSDQTLKYRLARIQVQSLTPAEEDSFNNEIIAVPVPNSGIVALGISARAMDGSGIVKVTGTETVASTMEIAWTYLRSEAKNLGLPDPNAYDFHIHLRDMSADINRELNLLSEYLGNESVTDENLGTGEELGLAFLLAMVSALSGTSGGALCVVGGRLDLQGRVYSSPQLAAGLQRMYDAGVRWKRLILPRAINADMEHMPQTIWSTPNLTLCSNARQAVKAWLIDS